MTSRKMLSFITAALCTASIFSGCSSAAVSKKSEAVTIKCFMQSLPTIQQTELLDLKDKFEKNHTSIKIEIEDGGNKYENEINNKIQSGQAPDIFMMDSVSTSKLAAKGKLLSFDELIDKKDLEDFNVNLLNQFRINGKLYGLPEAGQSLGLFYNKDMFNEAGLKPPTTWEELEAAATKLTKGNVTGLSVEYSPAFFIPFMLQGGGKIAEGNKPSFNSEACAKGLNFFNSLFAKKIAADGKTLSRQYSVEAFIKKDAAMALGFSGDANYVISSNPGFNWGVVVLPKGNTTGSFFQSTGIVVSNSTKNRKEAVEVAKFFSEGNVQRLIAESGIAIPSRRSMQQEYTKKYPQMEAFLTMLNNSEPLNYGDDLGKLFNALNDAGTKLQSGQMKDAKEALDYAVNLYNGAH